MAPAAGRGTAALGPLVYHVLRAASGAGSVSVHMPRWSRSSLSRGLEFVVVERLDDPALGEEVVAVGDGGREVTFCSTRSTEMPVRLDGADDLADPLHDDRGQALARLVEQQQRGAAAQHPGHGEHLLLATGQPGAREVGALAQHRELLVDLLERPGRSRAERPAGAGGSPRPSGWRRCRGRRAPSPGRRARGVGVEAGRRRLPSSSIAPRRWRCRPMTERSSVVLPAPLRPTRVTTSPWPTREVDVAQRLRLAVPGGQPRRDVSSIGRPPQVGGDDPLVGAHLLVGPSASTCPDCSTVTRSARVPTTCMLWSTSTTVRPRATRLTSSMVRSTSSTPMPAVGSSSSSSWGRAPGRGRARGPASGRRRASRPAPRPGRRGRPARAGPWRGRGTGHPLCRNARTGSRARWRGERELDVLDARSSGRTGW